MFGSILSISVASCVFVDRCCRFTERFTLVLLWVLETLCYSMGNRKYASKYAMKYAIACYAQVYSVIMWSGPETMSLHILWQLYRLASFCTRSTQDFAIDWSASPRYGDDMGVA